MRRHNFPLAPDQLTALVDCTPAPNVAIVASAIDFLEEYARCRHCDQLIAESIGPRIATAQMLLYPRVRLSFVEFALALASSGPAGIEAAFQILDLPHFFNSDFAVQTILLKILRWARESRPLSLWRRLPLAHNPLLHSSSRRTTLPFSLTR
jgi:hypothetical protein